MASNYDTLKANAKKHGYQVDKTTETYIEEKDRNGVLNYMRLELGIPNPDTYTWSAERAVKAAEPVEKIYDGEKIEIKTTISKGILADTSNTLTSEDQICKNYSVAEKDGVITIKADDLKEHANAGGVKGYWVGVAFVPEDGKNVEKVGYCIKNTWYEDELEADVSEGKKGLAIYFNHKYPSNYDIMVKWEDKDGIPVGKAVGYTVNMDNVHNYVEPAPELGKVSEPEEED